MNYIYTFLNLIKSIIRSRFFKQCHFLLSLRLILYMQHITFQWLAKNQMWNWNGTYNSEKKHITAATLARVLHLESQKFFLESHEEHADAQNTPSKPSLSTRQHRNQKSRSSPFSFFKYQPRMDYRKTLMAMVCPPGDGNTLLKLPETLPKQTPSKDVGMYVCRYTFVRGW